MERSPSGPPSGDQAGDSRPKTEDEVFEEFAERINKGESLDPEELRRRYPKFAERLIAELHLYEAIEKEPRSGEPKEPLGTLGDYTLRRQIGRGGMGVVYEAWENSMDRRVALKVLPPGVAAEERALHRFVREAKTAGQLGHPNIVGVYGMGLKEQTPYSTPWSSSTVRRCRRCSRG